MPPVNLSKLGKSGVSQLGKVKPPRPPAVPSSSSSRYAAPVQSLRPSPLRVSPLRVAPAIPPASAVGDVARQIAALRRSYNQLGIDYTFDKNQIAANKQLYLSQLADAYKRNVEGQTQDYANRGLLDSGIFHEALTRLAADRDKERSAYLLSVEQQVSQLARALSKGRADISSRQQALNDRLGQLRAERAAALRAAGYGV